MNINFTNNTIEMTKAELKAASVYNSDAYRELLKARNENPGFVVREVKSKHITDALGKMDMKAIRSYVEKHGTDEQKAKFAFISKRTVKEDGEYREAQPFFQIKSWFLKEFPEIRQSVKDYREKVQRIYDDADAKVAA